MRTAINQARQQSAYSGFFSRLKTRHCLYLCLVGAIFIYRSCLTAATTIIGAATCLMYAINRQNLARAGADNTSLRQTEKLIQSRQKALDDLNTELAVTATKLTQARGEYAEVKERLSEVQHELLTSEARLRNHAGTDKDNLENRLLQAQKMESIGRLAGGLAHDFNNLLSIMLGHAEIGLADPSIQDLPVRNTLTQILKAGERVHNLTRQLLAFGRKQALKREKLNLNHIILDFQPMLSRLMGEAIEIRTHLAQDIWYVFMDITQTEQILLNIAVNARDAMSEGGHLIIKTANINSQEPLPAGVDLPFGEYIELTISDSGCGIDEDTIAHIFEPFFTTKEHGKGTGLGLSTVYEIVKQQGGGIYAESSPGQGATFKIYLPRHIGDVQHETPSANGYACRFAGHESNLVADADSAS
ncbi:MAG: ATP-binding protein [Syntrophaceae bacterium]